MFIYLVNLKAKGAYEAIQVMGI